MSSPPPKNNAFTLIELLVVIAILIVIAFIGMAALGRVRTETAGIRCIGNLRNIGRLFTLYAIDHRNCLPMARRDSVDSQGKSRAIVWFWELFPYSDGAEEKEAHQYIHCPAWGDQERYAYSYAMERWAGTDTINYTGTLVSLADLAQSRHAGGEVNGRRWILMDSDWYMIDSSKGESLHANPRFRHHGRLNVLLGDFSVQTMNRAEMNGQLYLYRDRPLP